MANIKVAKDTYLLNIANLNIYKKYHIDKESEYSNKII